MTERRYLAIDIGTSSVKTIVWNADDGVLARGHAPVRTSHPQPGWDEQNAVDWWAAVQQSLDELPLDDVAAVGLSSQRETFACLDADARPLRPAILWSDGRGASPASRWAWLQRHEPVVADAARWLAAPKDYVLHQLVGRLVTDTTLASRTDLDPALLPEIVEPRTVVGAFRGVPVVAGAGDRACEAFDVGASSSAPMVSWGTTANCSFPLAQSAVLPNSWRGSTYVDGRTLAEAGLSAAGSALAWLSAQVSVSVAELSARAADSPPGANGVIVLPWLNGARAPWWRADAQMTVLGESKDVGDLARGIYEGVAHDLRRALSLLPDQPRTLSLVGGGATDPVWQESLSGICGVPVTVGSPDAAAIGAARLAAGPEGEARRAKARQPAQPLDRDLVATYVELSKAHDHAAHSALGSLP